MRDFDPTASEFITNGFIQRSRSGGALYDPMSIIGAVAGPLLGGLLGKESAGKAAEAQTGASRASDATQRYFYDTTRADNAPFRDTGLAANNRLAQLLGLGGGQGPMQGGQSAQGSQSRDQLRAQLINGFSTPGTPASQGVYGEIGNNGDRSPTMGYVGATPGTPGTIDEAGLNAAIDRQYTPQQAMQAGSDSGYGSLSGNFSAADISADPLLSQARRNFSAADIAADPLMGQATRNFSAADLAADPVMMADQSYMQPMRDFDQNALKNDLVYQNGLQFGLDNGNRAIERQAAAGGSTLSGATLKALTRFGNDYGTTKTAGAYDRFTTNQNTKYGQRVDARNRYVSDQDRGYGKLTDSRNRFVSDQDRGYNKLTDSFGRFNSNQDRTYNKLAGLSGAGQQATNQVTAAGQSTANQVSASQQGLGNAQGAAAIAQGNAMQNAVNGGVAAMRGSGYTNAMAPLFDGGYGGGTGSAYGGNTDNGMFTPFRRGM